MLSAINLVCTRCTDGNHAALQRWYNDHAQLLMASPQLQGAELFKLQSTTASMDYFCLYHFEELGDFSAFDTGSVMSDVRELSNAAPGRSSIEIVKRTQYERVLHRRWAPCTGMGHVQASLLSMPHQSMQEMLRWFNDVLYGLQLHHGLCSAQVYLAKSEQQLEIFVLLHTEPGVLLPADWHTVQSEYAQRPELTLLWQEQAKRIGQWHR